MTQARNLSVLAGNVSSSGVTSVAGGGTGSVTLTANNVLLGNDTSALQVVAPGTSGNVLQSNGTTWTSAASGLPSPGTSGNVLQSNGTTWTSASLSTGLPGILSQVFTSSGTFTIPSGVTAIKATVVGGGGGSGGIPGMGACNVSAGGGGGSGGMAYQYFSGLTPGNTITVTVGAGGTAGNSNGGGGGSGGTSSLTSGTQTISTLSANGGGGGAGGQNGGPSSYGLRGVGGTASGGVINIQGSPINSSALYLPTYSWDGSPSPLAPTSNFVLTSNPGVSPNPGVAATFYGAGASGARSGNTGNSPGAVGYSGIVIFEW